MSTLTQPLRDEHKELYPHIVGIRQAAELIGTATVGETRQAAEETLVFLTRHLLPHAEAEEAALYPVVQKALGSPDATRTMSRDHVEIGRYTGELASLLNERPVDTLTPDQAQSLQRVLYGLHALVSLHFAKEEEVYLPILDQKLSVEDARELFENLEAAAHKAKAAV